MRTVLVTATSTDDYLAALKHSHKRFGPKACARYGSLIDQAFTDLAENAFRLGTTPRFDLGAGIYFYHLKHSRKSVAKKSDRVDHPRHYVAFRLPSSTELLVLRIVHERMKFEQLTYFEDM